MALRTERPRRSSRRASAGASAGARLRRAAAGDRPYALALAGLVILLILMAIGPLRSLSAAQSRVDALEASREQLVAEVDALEERREVLQDPESLELIAREQLGLVKPGEIPFVVVTPEEDLAALGEEAADAGGRRSLWDLLRSAVTDLFR